MFRVKEARSLGDEITDVVRDILVSPLDVPRWGIWFTLAGKRYRVSFPPLIPAYPRAWRFASRMRRAIKYHLCDLISSHDSRVNSLRRLRSSLPRISRRRRVYEQSDDDVTAELALERTIDYQRSIVEIRSFEKGRRARKAIASRTIASRVKIAKTKQIVVTGKPGTRSPVGAIRKIRAALAGSVHFAKAHFETHRYAIREEETERRRSERPEAVFLHASRKRRCPSSSGDVTRDNLT